MKARRKRFRDRELRRVFLRCFFKGIRIPRYFRTRIKLSPVAIHYRATRPSDLAHIL